MTRTQITKVAKELFQVEDVKKAIDLVTFLLTAHMTLSKCAGEEKCQISASFLHTIRSMVALMELLEPGSAERLRTATLEEVKTFPVDQVRESLQEMGVPTEEAERMIARIQAKGGEKAQDQEKEKALEQLSKDHQPLIMAPPSRMVH